MVRVFSEQSDEDPFQLNWEDIVDHEGDFVFDAWSHNIKVGISLSKTL